MSTTLKPDARLLVKLASLAVHVDELISPDGHAFDRSAIETIINDAEVKAWLSEMGALGFLPVKRKS